MLFTFLPSLNESPVTEIQSFLTGSGYLMRTSKQDQAYTAIKEMLKDPQVMRNVSLSESDIARKLKMSRTPIRNALQKLSEEGLIISRDHLGMMVRIPSFNDLKECCETRLAMETYIIKKICPLLTTQDLFKLQNIMDSEKLAMENEDHNLFAETDRRFHGYFFTKFNNSVMCDIYDSIKDKLAGTDLHAYRIPRKMPFIYQEHMDILDALKSRNSEKVVKTLQVHLENFRNKYIRF